MNGNVLVTGSHGYLASALISQLCCNIIEYPGDVREYIPHDNLDGILHFASPSDNTEFQDRHRTITTIVDGTTNMLRIARENNCKIVYASTQGVEFIDKVVNDYVVSKLCMENYIKVSYNKYVILRIPRVYSKCRKKGLMKQIRENTIATKDMDNVVNYLNLQEFISQTLPILKLENITHRYNVTRTEKIKDIIQWVKE